MFAATGRSEIPSSQERTAQSVTTEVIVQFQLKAEVACSRGACGGREHV
jgi:hypothetical protein